MILSKRINAIRLSKKLTQTDIAEIIGVSQPTYSEYEKKADNCAFYTLEKIARALNVSVSFLVDIENEFDPNIQEND